MSSRALITIAILSLSTLASCVAVGQQSPDCEITFSALRSRFSEPSPGLQAWVIDTYGVVSEYSDADNTGELKLLRWSHNGTQFTVHVRGSTPIGAILSFDSRKNPTADEVIACLGAPEFYCASHGWDAETTKVELILRFPAEGIDAYGYRFDVIPRQQAPIFSGSFPIHQILIGDMSSLQYPTGQSSGSDAAQMFRPWQGNWRAVEVDAESCLNR